LNSFLKVFPKKSSKSRVLFGFEHIATDLMRFELSQFLPSSRARGPAIERVYSRKRNEATDFSRRSKQRATPSSTRRDPSAPIPSMPAQPVDAAPSGAFIGQHFREMTTYSASPGPNLVSATFVLVQP
jgi:hypothetical protein